MWSANDFLLSLKSKNNSGCEGLLDGCFNVFASVGFVAEDATPFSASSTAELLMNMNCQLTV